MMHNGNASGNGQNITAETNTTSAVTLPSPTACAGTYITTAWYAGLALMHS
jgi:hypothetical protein